MLPRFWARSEINCSKKLDISSSLELHSVNGVVGALCSSNDWFPLELTNDSTHHIMVLPKFWARSEINWWTKLETSSSYEVSSVNGVGGGLHSSSDWISRKTLNDSSHHIMMSPKFLARSKINWSKKLGISSSIEVRSVNVVVGALHSSGDWISLETHQITPPTIIWCSQCFVLYLKSIGQGNWTLHVRTKFVPEMEWLVDCIVLVIRFPSKLTEWLLPQYYDVAHVLGTIQNQ
jgi:hypothetical protein